MTSRWWHGSSLCRRAVPDGLLPTLKRRTTIDTALGLAAVCLLIAANAVFVAVEFGLVAADRGRIDQLASEGDRRAIVARSLLTHLPFSLGGAQLGISITTLVLGFLAQPVLASLFQPVLEPIVGESASNAIALVVALALATTAQMVLGELIPKSLAIAHPEPAALALGRPLSLFATVFRPVIWLLNQAANRIVRALGIEPQEELSHVRSLPELAVLFQASADEGTLAGNASALLTRSVRFGQKTAADVLVPRVAVKAVNAEATASDLVTLAAGTGHSRFPVFRGDLDDIAGVVHVKAVHAVAPGDRDTTPVSALMADAVALPESRQLVDVLFDIRWSRNHLVIVVDEYGGTAGILTLEDVLEEIVGEIDDEYDQLTPNLGVEEAPGVSVLPGSLHADEVGDAIGFEMPPGEYETLAGFVLDQLGHIPVPGEQFSFGGWTFEVVGLDRRRVASVRVSRAPEVGDTTGPAPREDRS
jgi:CBS domain containing-hemolysin-like protein